jgi:hypothetical protein
MAAPTSLILADRIERAILLIRGHKVMLDSDFAALVWRPDEGPESSSKA